MKKSDTISASENIIQLIAKFEYENFENCRKIINQ